MSYWVYLKDPNGPIQCDYGQAPDACSTPCLPNMVVPGHAEGGTHALGGTDEAELNITYNYSQHFKALHAEGIRWLDGKTGEDTAPALAAAVQQLGTARDRDYWAPTPGNAGYALSILLDWAQLHPQAVWQVSA